MWITPTTNDVLSEFTAAEAATIQNNQGAVSSNLPGVLTRTIDEIRDAIVSGGKQVDQVSTTTIPRGLVADAIAIARWRLLTAIPLLKSLQTDARQKAHDDALKKLESIASGKRGVEPPEGGAANRGGDIESIGCAPKQSTRETQSRL